MRLEVLTGGTGRYRQHGSCSRAPEPAALFGWSWKRRAYFVITCNKFCNLHTHTISMSHDNPISSDWLSTQWLGFNSQHRKELIASQLLPDNLWGRPWLLSIRWILGNLKYGTKWLEHKADHSHPWTAMVKLSPPKYTSLWHALMYMQVWNKVSDNRKPCKWAYTFDY